MNDVVFYMNKIPGYLISIAPMLGYTDRHFRFLIRLISKRVRLYTEMISTGALLQGKAERYLAAFENESPIALQLGGSNPNALAKCARIGEKHGYDEINLNLGCPSKRVQQGSFGAILMLQPDLVCDCIKAMQDAVDIPITVKTRIGINQNNTFSFLLDFIDKFHEAGCNVFILHARKADLQKLTPKQNRTVPIINYERVYQLKKERSNLKIIINGDIKTLEETHAHLENVDGVMIGRAVYRNPYLLSGVDRDFFNAEQHEILYRDEIAEQYIKYAKNQEKIGVPLQRTLRHLTHLFYGVENAKEKLKFL